MNYTETDKLIEVFMGHSSIKNNRSIEMFMLNKNYHDDWNQLMDVVAKIEELGYFCMINKWTSVYTGASGDRISVTTVEGVNKRLNTYQAVVEFIKYFNKNK